jgi:hypothetical protein
MQLVYNTLADQPDIITEKYEVDLVSRVPKELWSIEIVWKEAASGLREGKLPVSTMLARHINARAPNDEQIVVCGAYGRKEAGRAADAHIGSTAVALMRALKCSLVIVRPQCAVPDSPIRFVVAANATPQAMHA